MNTIPLINAILNSITTLLLIAGLIAVLRGHRILHQRIMITAVITSALFLAGYITHKVLRNFEPTYFEEQGWPRSLYLFILGTHTILAIVNLPMILRLLWLAYTEQFEKHRKLARWTWPIWMYVSVTGVLVYLMLYVIWPPSSITGS